MSSSDAQQYHPPLLREHVELPPGARVLEMGYYDPEGALWAAGAGAGQVVALRPAIDQAAALDRAAREAGLGQIESRLAVQPEAAERGTFDVALLLAPYFLGNVPVRQAMEGAAAALKPEGALYFQAHKRRGGETFVGYARGLFGDVELMGMGGGQRRLYRATGPRAGATVAGTGEKASEGAEALVQEVEVRGATLKLRLAAGVFSAHRVDPGSLLLAQTAGVPPGARVLDLGCGAGTIGLAVAAADPRSRVLLVDASRPAVELARENAALNGLQNVEVLLSDGYDALGGQRFDAILSNLPAHRGQQADSGVAERFIAGAPAHLREDGGAWFVANKALPYELPAARAFRRVRVAAGDGRYKVLHCDQPVPQRQRRR
jgi:16S rRNA (guanine1207-N2)-methyltransferase